MDFSEIKKFVSKHKKMFLLSLSLALLTLVLTRVFILENPSWPVYNDYSAYYFSAKFLLSGNFENIYDTHYLVNGTEYVWINYIDSKIPPFRYLPSMALYFIPLAFIDLGNSYTLFTILSYLCDILSLYILFKIIKQLRGGGIEPKREQYYSAVFLFSFIQILNYLLGQISSIMTFIILLSMYCYLIKKEFIGSLLLGLSLSFKPISYIIIIFVLLTSGNIKKFLRRLFFILIPLTPNLVFFASKPKLLSDFISMNSAFVGHILPSHAVSFITIFTNFLGYDKSTLFTVFALVTLIVLSLLFKKKYRIKNSILFSFLLGMAILFISQYDIWSSNLTIFLPILMISNTFAKNDYKKEIKLYIVYISLIFLNELLWNSSFRYNIMLVTSIVICSFSIYFYINVLKNLIKTSKELI